MRKIGSTIALVGIVSLILPFFNLEFRLLGWLDEMGTTGVIIKIAAVLIGGALFFFGPKEEEEAQPEADTAE